MGSRLAGKQAFVTAAGAGIGRATALAYLRECARERLDFIALENFQNGIPVKDDAFLDLPLFSQGE